MGEGSRAEIIINYNTYITHPPDPQLNPEEGEAFYPDLFPPARHLIGHQAELEQLLAWHQQLVETKEGRLVFITGQPGYGRLALARHLADYAQAHGTPVLVGRFKSTKRLSNEAAAAVWFEDPLRDLWSMRTAI